MGSQRIGYDLVFKQKQQIITDDKMCNKHILEISSARGKRAFWRYLTENQHLNKDIKEVGITSGRGNIQVLGENTFFWKMI